MLKSGIIVSIQQLSRLTTQELSKEAISAGAVAIRCDKSIDCRAPLIGLQKIKVNNRSEEVYITPDLKNIKNVKRWAYIISIDYRRINNNLSEISKYCKENDIKVIADIENIEDYENIIENDYYHNFIATTFSVFHMKGKPDIQLVNDLSGLDCKNIIAEGNYVSPWQVIEAYKAGAKWVCIGAAITNIYKLTKRYTNIRIEE